MAYRALYRLYRPQTLDEVVGQKYIIQTLKNAINEGRIAHAYLLTGPRGTGKTTIAKLIAKGVNCTGDKNKPCGECENCKAIENGTHPDVIEIDAASNNSVDEVRELIDKVKYAPIEGKYKVYIIDEVHMMTPSAFNALLKTLEEPPANVVFILATTEVHKVLPTIISRCQRFDFGRISNSEIEKRIKQVLEAEKINYEEGVVRLVATLADGGVRDALSILDQTIAYAGNDLTEKHVRDIYGVVSVEDTLQFLETFYNGDVTSALKKVTEFDQKGVDLVRFTMTMVDILKELIVYNKTGVTKSLKLLKEEQALKLKASIKSSLAFEYIDILMQASSNYRRVNSPKSYFELAVLKLCNTEKIEDVSTNIKEERSKPKEEPVKVMVPSKPKEEIVEKVAEIKTEISIDDLVKSIDMVPLQEVKEEPKEVSKIEPQQEKSIVEAKPVSNVKKKVNKPDAEITEDMVHNIMLQASKPDKTYVMERWNLIKRYTQKPVFQKVANLLLDGGPLACGSKGIIIGFDFEPRVNEVNSRGNYLVIKEFLKELLGGDYCWIGVTDDQFRTYKLHYIEKMKIGTLPPIKEIKDLYDLEELKSENVKEEEVDQTLELSKSIFGDLLKTEEDK